jgi:hypothetical protein
MFSYLHPVAKVMVILSAQVVLFMKFDVGAAGCF